MIDTIIFDYDGTLFPALTDEFTKVYFSQLVKKMAPIGYDKDKIVSSIWKGTRAMNINDGTVTNRERFWPIFLDALGNADTGLEAELDSFYQNEFNAVRDILDIHVDRRSLFDTLKAKGYNSILATTPVFPHSATVSRLSWLSLSPDDFIYTTDYSNCRFCKPDLRYYREIFEKTGRKPEECLMVGNSPSDDGCITQLGASFYLVSDLIENADADLPTGCLQGTFSDFEKYIMQFPAL